MRVAAAALLIAGLSLAASSAEAQLFSSSNGSSSNGLGANGMTSDATTRERQPWLTYGIDAGLGESDNVTLASTEKVSQTIAITDLDFLIKERSRLLEANVTGDFSYLDYLQHAFGNQLIGRFDGQGKLAIVPGRLAWVVEDNFGQAVVDPYAPTTPDNLENINYFSTGPELMLRLGGVNFVDLSARYARAQYQKSPFDSNRGVGSLALGRDISAGASVSINAQFERVMFDTTGSVVTMGPLGVSNPTLNADFNRSSAFGRYQIQGLRTELEADLGATQIRQGNDRTSGPLAKLNLSRQLTAAAKLTLTAARELTDASSSFGMLRNGGTPGSGNYIAAAPAPQTAGNYTSDFGSITWEYARNRTRLAVSARWEKDLYPGEPLLDSELSFADLTVERRLTRHLSVQLLGRYSRTDYLNADVATASASSKFDDRLFGAGIRWHHGHGLEIRLRLSHTSHDVSAGGSGYNANQAFLTVGYRPVSTRDSM